MRRLSNYEWLEFQNDIDVAKLNMPPWGTIVEWEGMKVLVFQNPQTHEVFLTDVSDNVSFLASFQRTYNPLAQVWWYNLPRETFVRILETAAMIPDMPATIGNVMKETAKVIGETAGEATGPLLSNLTLPLVAIGIVALLIYLPKGKSA